MKTFALYVAVLLALSAAPALGGVNSGGTACLSWNQSSVVTNIESLPGNPVALHVLLSGAPDVRSLAVHLRWSPADSSGIGYYVLSSPSDSSLCGTTSDTPPAGDFDGDTTYTWSICFPAGSADRSCVIYNVGTSYPQAADFCLLSVRTKDSNGVVDDLAITGNATILGGLPTGCSIVVEDVFPHVVTAGYENTLEITGQNFPANTSVALISGKSVIMASSVTFAGDEAITAKVTIPADALGPIEMIVGATGNSDTLAGRMNAPPALLTSVLPSPTLDFITSVGKTGAIRARSNGGYAFLQAEDTFPFFARVRLFVRDFDADAFDLTGNPWPRIHVLGATLDRDDQYYIAVAYYPTPSDLHYGVAVYSNTGSFLRSWDTPQSVGGIAMAADSTLWVSFGTYPAGSVARIVQYDRVGNRLAGEFVCPIPSGAVLLGAALLQMDGEGDLVTLAGTEDDHVLRRYSTSGSIEAERIFDEVADGTLRDLAVDRSGVAYCGHLDTKSVLLLDRSFQTVGSFGGVGTPNELAPGALGCDLNSCEVYVLETEGRTIRGLRTDIDRDDLCDSWEYYGLLAGSSVFTIPGASVLHKDIYVEVDAMEHHEMRGQAADSLVAAFGRVPNALLSPANPDSQPGITLHIERDEIGLPDVPWTLPDQQEHFASFKALHFGPQNDPVLRTTRALVYRYCVFAHGATEPGSPKGQGERFGNDFYVARGAGASGEERGSWQEQAGTFMHELGHNLGLFHGGADFINFKPNYRSVMNYIWQYQVNYTGSNVEPQWYLSYSNRPYNDLDETCLDELAGIGGERGKITFISPRLDIDEQRYEVTPIPEAGKVNFDYPADGDYMTCDVADVNRWLKPDGTLSDPSAGEFLQGQNDWGRLVFANRYSQGWKRDGHEFDAAVSDPEYEMTYEVYEAFQRMRTDCDGDGVIDSLEIALGEPDLDCDGVPDLCDQVRAEILAETVVLCPGGDADSLVIVVDLLGVCAANGDDPMLRVAAVRTDGLVDTLKLWTGSGFGIATSDTLSGVYDATSKQGRIVIRSGSGCGRVRFDVFADTLRVASGLEANVHGLDWDRRVVGAVDRFDRAKWLEALERGNIGDCGDFNGDGFETIGDTLILAAHMGHHRPRKVISPDGGEVWPVGTVHVTTWIPGAGDSAYVSLYLHRDLSPSFSVRVAVDVPDTGAFAWTIDSALANAPDYRIQAVHTAGLFDSVSTNSVGSDESDLPFTISGSTVSVAPGHDATWLSFGLDRGRPNPSRGPMSISFALPSGGHAQLQAFDLQGRLVRTLSDADYAAGRWTVEWDCRDRSGRPVRAGIYIIRLRAGGRYAEHKALVLR